MARTRRIFPLIAAALGAVATPAFAQDGSLADLDVLAEAASDPVLGLQLARDQIGESDLTGALATLERLLVAHADNSDALLLHASLLCRLDDRDGAQFEIDSLRRAGVQGPGWADVTAACGAMPRGGK